MDCFDLEIDTDIDIDSSQDESAHSSSESNENPSRHHMRSLVFHLLYAMDSFSYDVSLEAIVDNFNRGFNLDIPHEGEIVTMARAIIDDRQQLDDVIKSVLDKWRLERLGCCTRLILRLSLWELLHTQTPGTIIINEAIELAKCFAERDAYKFINGVLDEVLKRISAPKSDGAQS